VAVAVGFATFHKALDQGGVKEVSWEFKRAHEVGLAPAQGEGGAAGERLYLAHITR
jgi:alpha-D-ribose 1-methylphosphonate 5-triphosphate synthase subunit PhnG